MKIFLKILIFLVMIENMLLASELQSIESIALVKDEEKKFLIKYANVVKVFKFRWTLYKNRGLVVFRSYDRVVGQNILYLNHKNQSFKTELKTKGANFYEVPYLLVKFKEFKYENNSAIFELFLSDKREQIKMKELRNNESNI